MSPAARLQRIPEGKHGPRRSVADGVLTYTGAMAQATPAQRKRLARALADYLAREKTDSGPPAHLHAALVAPVVDGGRRVEHWTNPSRLDQLGLLEADPRHGAGRRWRLDYGAAYDRTGAARVLIRVDGDDNPKAGEERWLIAADKVRDADAAVGPVAASVLRAVLVQEVMWSCLFRPERDPETKKVSRRSAEDAKAVTRDCLALLADHYDAVDQVHKQGSARTRTLHAA